MIRFFAMIALLLFAAPLHAAEAKDPLERLQAILNDTRTIRASFIQSSEGAENSVSTEESMGQFQAKKPERFRWDYQFPYPQLILSDGLHIWYYEPDLKQVTRAGRERLRGTPAALLSSDVRLTELFHAESLPTTPWDKPGVRITPKSDPAPFQEAVVLLNGNKEEISDIILTDSLGVRSRFIFSNMEMNVEIADDLFVFTPPEGVDIIQDNKE